MDLKNILIIIFVQIILIVCQETDTNNAGKDIKTLTEKACKSLFYVIFLSQR